MTFDKRFDLREGRYYLRVFCNAISGDVGNRSAVLKINKPALGKYYYPHGVEYDEDEVFPVHLVKECEEILENVKKTSQHSVSKLNISISRVWRMSCSF